MRLRRALIVAVQDARQNRRSNDIYRDYAIYLRAFSGEDLDAAIEHFRAKIAAQDDPMREIRSAQVLVGLLVRRERYREAMQISLRTSERHLDQSQLACPTLFQLCQLAGDSARLEGNSA